MANEYVSVPGTQCSIRVPEDQYCGTAEDLLTIDVIPEEFRYYYE